MNAQAWIAAVAAGISVLSLLATIWFARKAAQAATLARSITIGQAETTLRAAISNSRQSMRTLGTEIAIFLNGRRRDQLNAEEKRKLQAYEGPFREAMEDNLNAYEDACGKYLDTKIDRDRFHKMYVREIQTICECDGEHPMHELMHPEVSSKFQAIWKVYREWFHHEK